MRERETNGEEEEERRQERKSEDFKRYKRY